jgi:hypothetical protein
MREMLQRKRVAAVIAVMVMLFAATGIVDAQVASSSSVLSSTVVASWVTSRGQVALVVLWRGQPGWWGGSRSGHGGGGGRAGQETAYISDTFGKHTLSAELNLTSRTAIIIGQTVSLAETNVVLVDDIDVADGAQIVGRFWIDPSLPQTAGAQNPMDPVIVAIRRAGAFEYLQCDVPLPAPPGIDVAPDPAAAAGIMQGMQQLMSAMCNQIR